MIPIPFSYHWFGCFRLGLAILVFLQHALVPMAPVAVEQVLGPLALGSMAVLVFFALSGFVVTEAACRFYRERPGAFLANRMLRIYPSYLLALAVTAATAAAAIAWGRPEAVVAHVGGLPTLSPVELSANAAAILPAGKSLLDLAGALPLIDIAWALRVELAYYGLLFLMLAASVGLRVRLEPLAVVVGGLLLAIWVSGGDQFRDGLFGFMPFFVFGAAVHFSVSAVTAAGRRLAVAFAGTAMTLSTLYVLEMPSAEPTEGAGRVRVLQTIVFVVLTGLWLALLNLPRGWASGSLLAVDRFAGEVTYPLYLLHTATCMAVSAAIPERGWLALSAGLAVSLAAAAAAVVTYEQAIGRWRNRVRGRPLPLLA
ncbi:MAG: acyltransferase family protein [Hyphomicrobium sp.]